MPSSLKSPVRYDATLEQREEDEAETERGLNDALHQIQQTTADDYKHAVRGVHAKAHAMMKGTLTVASGLSAELAQGLFAQAGEYSALLRFSTNPGDILDDSISVPRGLAIKLLDVPGDRLEGSDDARTQDLILVNGPAFAASTGKQFLGNLTLLAKSTDKAEWAKKALSAVLRGTEAALEAVGGESAMLKTMGGAPNVHPLGETYYSQTAFGYGDHVAKFSLVPVSSNLTGLTGETVNATGRPDALREDIAEVMVEGDAEWELRVQLCRDRDTMPIEDPSKPWDEEESPFQTVARLRVPAQESWSNERQLIGDDQLRFSVWTGLAAHRPLGVINRLRKSTYEKSSGFRADFNRCPIHEPATSPID